MKGIRMNGSELAIRNWPGSFSVHAEDMAIQSTRYLQFQDITEAANDIVDDSGITHGMVNIQTCHTTAALLVNENESLLLDDLRDTLDRVASPGELYRHNDFSLRKENMMPGESENGHSHCQAMLLPTSQCLNIVRSRIQLGRWQRIFFIELDGARERTISIVVMGV